MSYDDNKEKYFWLVLRRNFETKDGNFAITSLSYSESQRTIIFGNIIEFNEKKKKKKLGS